MNREKIKHLSLIDAYIQKVGQQNPDNVWVFTPVDTWHRNPFFSQKLFNNSLKRLNHVNHILSPKS